MKPTTPLPPIGENTGVGIGFLRVRATLNRCNLPQAAALLIPNALFEEYQKIVLSDCGYVLGLTTLPKSRYKACQSSRSKFKLQGRCRRLIVKAALIFHLSFASGGHHLHSNITHAKHETYNPINISWGKSQYKILSIQ